MALRASSTGGRRGAQPLRRRELVPERLVLAVGSIAGCEVAFAMTLQYIKQRPAFGLPIGSFQELPLRDGRTEDQDRDHPLLHRPLHRATRGWRLHRRGGCDGKWWTTDLLGEVTAAACSYMAVTATRRSTRSV
ncbi:MAG: hypothetical protein M3Z13_06835 [Candidatus Dormibacteraeota bacterium]|nr:hypothetical protein [Candidatus Dormibacteraeota bacterium]